MIQNCRLFVEGDTDFKLLKDVVQQHFHYTLTDKNVFITNGYEQGWITKHKPNFERAIIEGYRPVILVDADDSLAARNQEIVTQMSHLQFNFPLFLWPNNQDDGAIENLLLELVNPAHQSILSCFDNYENCISPPYDRPNDKARVFAYLDAVLLGARKKELRPKERNYLDHQIWDLGHHSLSPLLNFLSSL